ncbi:MAG: precorrin-3B C(17)-methyltransferase [Nitrospirae bacterium]|nr:precorrin-3B C(17)-methyltransferase [Nitrospirota bacterium]
MNKSKLYIVGIGPGGLSHITPAAVSAINQSNVIVGYSTYIKLIEELIESQGTTPQKEIIDTGMTKEIERCTLAIQRAIAGNIVSIICSGDPGIYAMAGLVFQLLKIYPKISVEVIPGVPALSAAASRLGAPLMNDFASISLSDRLTPWEMIEKRVHAVSSSDFVIVFYNPKSKGRKDHLKNAVNIILKYRDPITPVGIVKSATRINEKVIVTTLDNIPYDEVDMQTIVIVGNSKTLNIDGLIVTPRGYEYKYELK